MGAKHFEINTPMEFVGVWWLPGYEEDKVVGELKYTDERLTLYLESYFKHLKGLGSDDRILDTINGKASGHYITLLNCFVSSAVIPQLIEMAEYAPSTIVASYALIGVHISSEEDVLINSLVYQTTNIKPWTQMTGFRQAIEFKKDEQNKFKFNITYELPDKKILYTSDNVEISLGCETNLPNSIDRQPSMIITEKNQILIKNSQNKIGLFFFEYIDALRKFISIAMRLEVEPIYVKLMVQVEDNEFPCYLLYTPIALDIDYKKRSSRPENETLFKLTHFEGRIGYLLENWFNLYERIPELLNLYFYPSKRMLDDVFFTKARALEAYYDNVRPDSVKCSFVDKMKRLYEDYYDIMQYRGDKDSFAELVKIHRHYYAHFGLSKKSKVFYGINLDFLARDVTLLLEMCLLTAMGIPKDDVVKLILNYIPYRDFLGIHQPKDDDGFPKHRIAWTPDKVPS